MLCPTFNEAAYRQPCLVRDGCRDRIDEPRERRVGALLGVLWLLSLGDLCLTVWAHRYTPFHEVNPIARAMLESGAVGVLVLYKLALTGCGTTIFWHVRRHGRAELALWAVVLVYVRLAVQWAQYAHGVIAMGMQG